MNCKNCNKEVNLNYCSSCGNPVYLKRINRHYIFHEIGQVLNFEKGIFYTIRGLSIRPGNSIKNFITENRSRLMKPITFIIVTSLIYSLVNNFFHIEDRYINYDGITTSAIGTIFKWFQSNYGYANIIMGFFIGFWAKIFFKRYAYNFYEILILLCYVMGMGMLIFSVFAMLQGVTHFNLMSIAGIVGFAYITWAISQFYGKEKLGNYVKAFFAYILGMITCILTAIIIGTMIDVLVNH